LAADERIKVQVADGWRAQRMSTLPGLVARAGINASLFKEESGDFILRTVTIEFGGRAIDRDQFMRITVR
jgi:hypothetical protein